ncbi:MAG TPA: DUF4142 domain-containing protein [Polyangia bacterium]
MKHLVLACGVAILAPAAVAHGQTSGQTSSTPQVLSNLHLFSVSQIEMGKLARTNGQSDQVRSFGKDLVNHFQDVDRKLIDYAQKRSLSLVPPGASGVPGIQLDQELRQVQQLYGLHGTQFDQQFLATLTLDYNRVVVGLTSFKAQVDPELRNLIDHELIPRLNRSAQRAAGITANLRRQGQQGWPPSGQPYPPAEPPPPPEGGPPPSQETGPPPSQESGPPPSQQGEQPVPQEPFPQGQQPGMQVAPPPQQ